MQTVFRRVEKKYIVNKEQKDFLLNTLDSYIREDNYGKSTICNIYFDNDGDELINTSLEKPTYKEKVRLRSYGVPNLESKVFLEIKKKFKGVVGKRRVVITLKELYKYLEKGIYPNCDKQIMREIDYCFRRYNLEPKLFLAYDREAYYFKDDDNFRITFDYNIRSRVGDLRLELGDFGDLLLDEDIYVMEIKTLGALPLWFTKVLNENQIYPTSFSKYGRIYEKLNRKERVDVYV